MLSRFSTSIGCISQSLIFLDPLLIHLTSIPILGQRIAHRVSIAALKVLGNIQLFSQADSFLPDKDNFAIYPYVKERLAHVSQAPC